MSLSPQQITLRRNGIGGSDIAALAGLDPYRSAHDVFMDKTGRGAAVEVTAPIEWGHILEPVIALHYAKVNKVQVAESGTIVHPARPWQMVTPDRFVFPVPSALPAWGLEVKAKGFYQKMHWGPPGDAAGVPDAVALQCHWALSVTELERWDVACLINNSDYRQYTLTRDAELEADLLELAHAFWTKHVLADTPPPVDGSEGAARMLKRLYPRERAPLKPAPAAASEWVRERAELLGKVGDIETEIAKIDAVIKATIGDAEGIEGPGFRATWKTANGQIDWKAAAEAAGITPENAEHYRRAGSRRLNVRIKGAANE